MVGVALEVGGGCEVDLVKSAFFLTLSSAENENAKYYLNTRVLPGLTPQQREELAAIIKPILDRAETRKELSPRRIPAPSRKFYPIASATALPHATVSALPPRSRVRKVFSASTRSMASTMARPASFSPR